MEENIKKIIQLIKVSDLDDTIKNILIRDLEVGGMTDFLREQIIAYCLSDIQKQSKIVEEVKQMLGTNKQDKTV